MTRKPALSVALLLVAMIAAVSGAGAQSPASAAGSISINNYLPEVRRLGQAQDWVGVERIAREALRTLSAQDGSNSVSAASATVWLATALQRQGRYSEAAPLLERALAVRENALGPDHLDLAPSLIDLAFIYGKDRQYAKAETLLERALAIREKALGPDHPDVATVLFALGSVYQAHSRYVMAESVYARAVEIFEKVRGSAHPDVATVLVALASVYHAQSQNAKAEPLFQRALAIQEKALGPDHPDVAKTLNNLAYIYQDRGQYAKAEELLQRALSIREKAPGPDHLDLALTLNDLAYIYQHQGQYAKAEPLYQRALAIREQALGPDDPNVALILNNLAMLYQAQGQLASAEPLYLRALSIREKALGPDDQYVAQSLNSLAALYFAQGQYSKVEQLEARALAIWEKARGPDDPNVANSLNGLAMVYLKQSQYDKAEPLLLRALGIYQRARGPDHPNVAVALNALGDLYREQGLYAKADPQYQRALEIEDKVLGPDDPLKAMTREMLARSETSQGRFDEATGNFRLACSAQVSQARPGNPSGDAAQAIQASASECYTWYALSLWNWSSQGGGTASADRPEALKLEAFVTSQRAIQSAAGTAMARSAALTAANSTGVGPEARDYEAAVQERERLDEEYAKAAGAPGPEGVEQLQSLAKARTEAVSRIDHLETVLQTKSPLYWDYRAPKPVSVAALNANKGPDASLLHENEALILWLIPAGKERGLVFAVSKEKAAWVRVGLTGNQLQTDVVTLRAQIDPEGYALRGIAVAPGSPAAVQPAPGSPSFTGEKPSVSMARPAFDRHLAYEMYQALLGDSAIHEVIRDKAVLLFVPSGPLTALPPGLLVTADPASSTPKETDAATMRATAWLLRSEAVALLPAVSSLRTLRQILPTGHAATDPLLAFADPLFTAPLHQPPGNRIVGTPRAFKTYFRDGMPLAEAIDSLPELPGTRIEAEALRRALGAAPDTILLGRDASKAQLMARNADGRLARVRVLEFATHGLVAGDVSDFAEPGLVLAAGPDAKDALLLASEASTLRLNSDWVLLSACNTASPDAPEAQGLSGLARAFFYAGARSLLVSQWRVRDDVAPILVPAVIKAQRDNPQLSRADALRKASLAVLDDPHLDAASPAAWATFTLIGEPGRNGS